MYYYKSKSFKQKINRKLSKRLNGPGYVRLKYILKRFALPYWKTIFLLFICNLLMFVLSSTQTIFTAATIDALTGQYLQRAQEGAGVESNITGLSLNNLGSVAYKWMGVGENQSAFRIAIIAGVLAFITELIKIVFSFILGQVSAKNSQKIASNIQLSLFKQYLLFSIGFFNRNKAGQMISRMETDAVGAISGIQNLMNSFIVSPLMIVFYMFLTYKASIVLFYSILIAGAAHQILSAVMSKRIQKNTKEGLNIGANYKSLLMEAFIAIRVVKSFAAEKYETQRIQDAQKVMIENRLRSSWLSGIQGQSRGVINSIVRFIILGFTTYELFVTKNITVSSALLFIFICNQVVQPINTFSGGFMTLQNMMANAQRVYKYFRLAPEVIDGNKTIKEFHEKIEYHAVGFSYEKKPVLQNINISIKKGETVALVGPSGAGKSTFVDLALRFYDPKQGNITIDGIDLKEIKQADYRRLFGVVSQESILFNATIAENIGYARENITKEQIERAARVANAYDFIMDTTFGFDTYVGDRGIRLSGGQRQRIAIARAVVANPQILIMDEATSSLDSESEKEVQKAIKQVTQNMTAIVIAHRLSTILHAHQIIVLDKGNIVDIGRHKDLLSRCELYQNLYKYQFEVQEDVVTYV